MGSEPALSWPYGPLVSPMGIELRRQDGACSFAAVRAARSGAAAAGPVRADVGGIGGGQVDVTAAAAR